MITDFAEKCRAEGGLIQLSLGELRESLDYKKLGRNVLAEIADKLTAAGLGYFPLGQLDGDWNTEPRQHQMVWLYLQDGGPRARVLDAVLDPEGHDVRAILGGLFGGTTTGLTAEQKLERIRDLVRD